MTGTPSQILLLNVSRDKDSIQPLVTSIPLDRETWIERAMISHQSALISYASTILNDNELAKDVVQDTFIRLCHQDEEKIQHNLKPWLFTVCRNRAFDILRKEKHKHHLDDSQWRKITTANLQPDEVIDQQEKMARLSIYLERLSHNQRDVIILKFQQGLSYKEINIITGLTTSNIGVLIHTGLKRLNEWLPEDFRP